MVTKPVNLPLKSKGDIMPNIIPIHQYQNKTAPQIGIKRAELLLKKVDVFVQKIVQLEAQISDLQQGKLIHKKISFSLQDGISFIPIDEIIRCEAMGNYTSVYVQNQKSIIVSMTLKSVQNKIADDRFVRVHASHLVNRSYVRKIMKNGNPHLCLSNGEEVAISRGKLKEVLLLIC